jgi:hypothetical protein
VNQITKVPNATNQRELPSNVAREAGWSNGQIARELNRLGVKTKRAGQKLKLRSLRCGEESATNRTVSGLWQAEQVTTLLNSTTVQNWIKL